MPLAMQNYGAEVKPQRLFRMTATRRNVPRVSISIGGRFMRENRIEYAGTVTEASVQFLRIETDAACRVGERIVGYFYTVGRIEGKVHSLSEGSFLLELAATEAKRDKLASQFTWLANRALLNLPEDRRHDRIVPRDPRVTVRNLSSPHAILLNGHIIDVSPSGIAVSVVGGDFANGQDVMIGSTKARIVRAFDGGLAAEFYSPLPDAIFNEGIRF